MAELCDLGLSLEMIGGRQVRRHLWVSSLLIQAKTRPALGHGAPAHGPGQERDAGVATDGDQFHRQAGDLGVHHHGQAAMNPKVVATGGPAPVVQLRAGNGKLLKHLTPTIGLTGARQWRLTT